MTDFADETLRRHPYTRALHEALPGRGFAALPRNTALRERSAGGMSVCTALRRPSGGV